MFCEPTNVENEEYLVAVKMEKKEFCSNHKKTNMVDIISKRCVEEGCTIMKNTPFCKNILPISKVIKCTWNYDLFVG